MRSSGVSLALLVGLVGCSGGVTGADPNNFGTGDSGPTVDPSATSNGGTTGMPPGTSSMSSGQGTTWSNDDTTTTAESASDSATSTGPASTSEGGSSSGGEVGSTGGASLPPLNIDVMCNGAASTYEAMMWEAPELHVYGVYESSGNHAITAPSSVAVDRGTNVVLVLSSYESTEWTVTAAPGTTIDQIILNGYENHLVNAPAGVPVDDRSGIGNYIEAAAYQYGSPEVTNLVTWAEAQTGLTLTSFSGCYQSAQLSIGQP